MSDVHNILVIGAPGQGKSPFIKSMIEGNRCFVFDVQNEYGAKTKYPGQTPLNLSNNLNSERARFTTMDVKEFLRLCSTKKNTVCVFEEATAFFQGATNEIMRRHLINRYHTGNPSLLVFHSINAVPPRFMEMCNYCVLFKTNDQEDNVYRKYGRLSQYFIDLQQKPDGSKHFIKLI